MVDPIELTIQALQYDVKRMGLIANNSANALTPGFKRELIAVSSTTSDSMAGSSVGNHLLAPSIYVDHSAGSPSKTGAPFDVAVLGDGYFEIRTDRGMAYTRLGHFHLDDAGRIVTQDGFPIQGQSGDVSVSSVNPLIDREGQVLEQGIATNKLRIVAFEHPELLKSIGSGLLIADGDQQPEDPKRPQVLQGYLESSNVDSAREMISLVETYRHFESSARVLQAYDDLRDKTFRNLGQF